ncbi:MAG: hypothetical protein ACOH18_00375 [Candidatus Saccharimonadaceae bacterium]
MTSLKTANRRVGSLFAVAALVLATITPGLVPAFASAAQVTARSITLSSSSKAASDVSYTVDFTSVGAASAFTVEFCSNSPLVNSSCAAPAGFTTAAVSTSTGSFTAAETTAAAAAAGPADHNAVAVTGTVGAATAISVVLDHIHNPTNAGSLYARIVTYSSGAGALAYQSETLGTYIDQGGAAASITDSVGVSGAVLETMTFCVAGNVIDQDNCTNSGGPLEAPTLRLGETVGTTSALDATHVSTGNVYTQLSTNASSGAVVRIKSGNTCAGLQRVGAADCDIAAAQATDVALGEAKIGLKVIAGSDPSGAFGTFQIADTATTPYYSASIFKLFFDNTDAAGVTSPFGDSLLDTNSGPASNKNAAITFGASITNNTPAGLYSNDYSLIATGKY